MRKILVILFLLSAGLSRASQPAGNMNLGLCHKLSSAASPSEIVHVLVKGDAGKIKDFLAGHSGKVIGSAGDILSLQLTVSDVATLIQQSFVQRIEAYPHHYKPLNDTMRMLCRVNEVQQGQAPLLQPYDGTGVLMGYIDSGIDLHHPDFQDSLGHTRVKWLWDMTKPVAPNTPQPYGYGQEWNNQQIDSGLASIHTGEDEFGHGNYVTGIGSGNGRAVGHFQGVAPKSDLVVVCYDFNANDTVPRISHAVQYIFDRAQQLGKPCVINASLGDYYGSHDGLDLESQYVRNVLNQQPGRVLVAAAGNVGIAFPFHVGRNSVTGDTAFTWFKYNASIPGAYVQIFADTADFNHVRFSIGADKVTPYYENRGHTAYSGIASSLGTVITRNLYNGSHRLGVIQTYGTLTGGVYSLEVYVVPDSTDYNWRFITTGNGHFDSWSFDWAWQSLPADTVFPDMAHYWAPDTNQSIVSGIACLDEVITVGNYFNTDRHLDVDSVLQITPTDKPRQLADNSSRGPTRDNRNKPDICAPGHHIISTGVLTLIPGLISGQPYKVALGGYHITGGGTSASAPVVAGIAALYLQQVPNATWSEVKAAITGCAAHDQYTWGPYPNNAWGYGKADAFGTLTACSPVGIKNINAAIPSVTVFPNPATDLVNVSVPPDLIGKNLSIEVQDAAGRVFCKISCQEEKVSFDIQPVSPGLYWVKLLSGGVLVNAAKLMVVH